MPVAVHTIGDQALENVLDVLDQFPSVAYRDRLIHVQVLREELIKRLAAPDRIADIQPRLWPVISHGYRIGLARHGPDVPTHGKTLMNSGVICAGGSDCPVEPIDPLFGIHAAVTRKAPGQSHAGWNPDERLSVNEAFRLFTELGAYPTNEEKIKGTISRGKLADMTVYSQNPFTLKLPDQLTETEIDMTIIGGSIKHQR